MTSVVAVLFPHVAQLDLTGPAQVFAAVDGIKLHLAAASLDPVPTDSGFAIVPTVTFADAPVADVLMVPGGRGVNAAMLDDEVLGFVRKQALSAWRVTSVCTGSLVLGSAGVLTGKRATTHWASLPLLPEFGAQPVAERVVRDGNVVTGAGVTSGIDLALTLVGDLVGEDAAHRAQLDLEYDPQPPFAVTPTTAPVAWVEDGRAAAREIRLPLVRQAAAELSTPGAGWGSPLGRSTHALES